MTSVLDSSVSYILIVDHDKIDYHFLRPAIAKIIPDAIIESLYDELETVSYIDRHIARPNLIFLELTKSKISGENTIVRIKKNQDLAGVPVIILSTASNDVEKSELLALGADAFYAVADNEEVLNNMLREIKQNYFK